MMILRKYINKVSNDNKFNEKIDTNTSKNYNENILKRDEDIDMTESTENKSLKVDSTENNIIKVNVVMNLMMKICQRKLSQIISIMNKEKLMKNLISIQKLNMVIMIRLRHFMMNNKKLTNN